jgi:hypothetical protein
VGGWCGRGGAPPPLPPRGPPRRARRARARPPPRGGRAGGAASDPESLLEILYDTEIAPDHLLPDTGLGLELERLASAPFIVSTIYGTRCSTALVRSGSSVSFVERRFDPGPVPDGETRIDLEVVV